ncbi:hypothetical protein DIPPA_04656 [Diplonema papillatum]|nr:hypothetical protein DIPPA_04656 [Diplonema papillatum]
MPLAYERRAAPPKAPFSLSPTRSHDPRSASSSDGDACSPYGMGLGAEVKRLRKEGKRLMDDNARLRAAAADATAQRDRLEPALEECMDLLLQVSNEKNAKAQTRRTAACQTAPAPASGEVAALKEKNAELQKELHALHGHYERLIADLKRSADREKGFREQAKELAGKDEKLATLFESVAEAKRKLSAREEELIEARIASAASAAALAEERGKRERATDACQVLQQKLEMLLSMQRELATPAKRQPIDALAADADRIRSAMRERQQAASSHDKYSLSPDAHTTPSPQPRPAHDSPFSTVSSASKAGTPPPPPASALLTSTSRNYTPFSRLGTPRTDPSNVSRASPMRNSLTGSLAYAATGPLPLSLNASVESF